ncbi:MAG: C1 family peptidase [Bdellovibrionales bacterium]|jgi:hypothetical protein|nr:C1 family peptidase [Bdellovibrionales bacterium]MBT3526619.1 C1 family peptidase [Bdellovibrionales bacterium]MBT7670612.1 C1 family peptidase [Bdellovibrionales bacterium]
MLIQITTYLTCLLLALLPLSSLVAVDQLPTDQRAKLVIEQIQQEIIKQYGLTPNVRNVTERKLISPDGADKQDRPTKHRTRVGPSGKEKVEMMLQKNRERIKKIQQQRAQTAKQQRAANRKTGDWMQDRQRSNQHWLDKKKKEIDRWQQAKQKVINQWIKERKNYFKRIPQYKKGLAPIPAPVKKVKLPLPPPPKPVKRYQTITKQVEDPIFGRSHYVKGAFTPKIKDQGQRPTCAAFAGVRGLEVLLAGQDRYRPLSEQYFYWASKPKCQNRPCDKRGSWVVPGLKRSMNGSMPDLPTEKQCSYNKSPKQGNETQTPLPSGCNHGAAKVERFYQVNSLSEIKQAIANNHPVIGGFKLSPNFYKNRGFISLKDSRSSGKVDSHAAGHALLIIGTMPLPAKVKEGGSCLIVANSWSTGWGQGGHACISAAWFKKYRYDNMAFIALESVR